MNDDRSQYLGATDVVAICGISPYASPLDVWLEKTGQVAPKEESPAMRRGRLLEPIVAQLYEETENCVLEPVGRVRMPSKPYLGAAPDRLRRDVPCLVEIKTHRGYIREQYGDPWSGDVPDHIYGQVMWQMHVAKRAALDVGTFAHVAAWFDADELAIFRVPYDEELAAAMEDLADKFWYEHVMPEKPPELIGHPKEIEGLRRLYPREADIVIQADEELENLVETLKEARAAVADAERTQRLIEARIMERMGEASVLETSYGRITWRTSKPSVRRSTDYDLLREIAPEVYDQVVKEVTSPGTRRFCVPRSWNISHEEERE